VAAGSTAEARILNTSAAVTVVIPTIGRPSLRTALESAREQDCPTEIIVVLDDPAEENDVRALTDGVGARLIVTSGRIGGAAARNLGADAGSAAYIAFLDDDDWWEPSKLRKQVAALESAPHARACATLQVFHDRTGRERIIPTRIPAPGERVADYLVGRPELYYGTQSIQTSCLMVRREADQATRWSDDLPKHQDWDFLIELSGNDASRVTWVPEPLTHTIQASPGSISARPDWAGSERFLRKHADRLSSSARADFVCVHILRAVLASKSFRRLPAVARTAGRARPHLAALALGLSGLRGM
jgi:glycosyltransferase involved in cell wall biosynthesis